jgi:hypothetical protein
VRVFDGILVGNHNNSALVQKSIKVTITIVIDNNVIENYPIEGILIPSFLSKPILYRKVIKNTALRYYGREVNV